MTPMSKTEGILRIAGTMGCALMVLFFFACAVTVETTPESAWDAYVSVVGWVGAMIYTGHIGARILTV